MVQVMNLLLFLYKVAQRGTRQTAAQWRSSNSIFKASWLLVVEVKQETRKKPACFPGRFLTKKFRLRKAVCTPCPCGDSTLSCCPQRPPPHTPGVAGWWHLCSYTTGLHCNVRS